MPLLLQRSSLVNLAIQLTPSWHSATAPSPVWAPGIMLVAVDDGGTVAGFAHVLDIEADWHLERLGPMRDTEQRMGMERHGRRVAILRDLRTT